MLDLTLLTKEQVKEEKIDLIYSNTSVVDLGYRISKILKLPLTSLQTAISSREVFFNRDKISSKAFNETYLLYLNPP